MIKRLRKGRSLCGGRWRRKWGGYAETARRQEAELKELRKVNYQLQESLTRRLSREEFTEYSELQRHKQWHMQYSYDNKISQIVLAETEKRIPGNRKRLDALKQLYEGKRCFLIGNGPSLRADDLGMLKGELTFAVNKIPLIFGQTDWRPFYYIVSDPVFFSSLNDWVMESSGKTRVLLDQEFLNIVDRKYWKDVLWYYHNTRYSIIPEFSNNPAQMVYEGGSVLYIAAQFAVYMGVREIYLLGVDNNYKKRTLDDGREVIDFYQDNHFYSSSKEERQRLDNYASGWMDYKNKVSSGTYDLDDMWKAVKYHCDQKGIRVMNATRGGELEVFPRVKLEEIIQKDMDI